MHGTSRQRGFLGTILLVALGLRLAAALWLADTYPYSDYFYYHEAGRLTSEDWSLWLDAERIQRLAKLSWWPPGYPMFLGAVYELLGPDPRAAVFVQVVLATLVCALVYAIGRLVLDARLGLVAALLVALDPTYVFTTNLIASENLFALWFALGLWLAVRPWRRARDPILLGIVLALATFTRAIALLLPVVVALWKRPSSARDGGGRWRAAWAGHSGWLLASFLVLLLPWAIRNAAVVGSPALVSHGGGLNFYFGHNDSLPGYREIARTPMAGLRTPGEIDRRGWQLGLQHLARRPLGFATRGVQKLSALFGSAGYALQANNAVRLPEGWEEDLEAARQAEVIRARQRPKARVLRGVLTDAADLHARLLLAGALLSCLMWRRMPAELRLMLWITLYWVGAHVVFWAQPRFRYPLDIPLALLASFTLLASFSAVRTRIGRRPEQEPGRP